VNIQPHHKEEIHMEEYTGRSAVLTTEERRLVVETIDGLMDARAIGGAVANAKRRNPDAAGKTRRMGEPVGAVVQQLYFWDHAEGELEDDFTHKAVAELALETRMTEARVRSGLETAIAEGLLEAEKIVRPSDRRPVWAYRVNVWEMFRVAFRSEVEIVGLRLERERRARQRAALEGRLEALRVALDDLELRFAEPVETATEFDADDLPDFGDIAYCGCGDDFCDGTLCLEAEPEYDSYEPDSVPLLTDHDAPEESAPVDWLPDDLLGAESADAVAKAEVENAKVEVETANSHILQKSTAEDNSNEVHDGSSFTTQNRRGDSSFHSSRHGGFEEQEEPMSTTPARSANDSLGTAGQGKVSTIPTKTTEPMSARKAWAMYDRGEITLEELTTLSAPGVARERRAA